MTFERSGAGSTGTAGEKDIPAHRLEFDTTGKGGLIGPHIMNTTFMVLTLFIYRFWALTRVRRAIWPRMSLGGTPLVYTGSGLEIFLRFLKVFLLILLPYAIFSHWVNFRCSAASAAPPRTVKSSAEATTGRPSILARPKIRLLGAKSSNVPSSA